MHYFWSDLAYVDIIQNGNIVIGNLSFENLKKVKGVTITNISDIREEIKCRINMGNALLLFYSSCTSADSFLII